MLVRLEDITIPEKRKRGVDEAKVKALAASIKEQGQLQPIGLTNGLELIWGLHRLEALKLLNKPQAIVIIMPESLTAIDRELIEIDENVIRAELSELELGLQLARRKELYELKYPQTKQGGDRRSKRQVDGLKAPPSFADDTAESTGLSPRSVQRKVKLAKLLEPFKEVIQNLPLADNQRELEALSRLKPDELEAVLAKLSSGDCAAVGEALSSYKQDKREIALERAQAAPEAAEEAYRAPTAQPGKWYTLGRHYLYCGDTSDPAFWQDLVGISFGFADPPYNAGVDEWDQGSFIWAHDWLSDIAPVIAVTPGNNAVFDFARCTTMPYRWLMSVSITNGMAVSPVGYHNFDPVCLFANEPKALYRRAKDEIRVTIKLSETDDTQHKGRKNLEAMISLVQLYTDEGEAVVDPFAGSGQTLIACEATNRICYTGEINPEYCTQIMQRYYELTGIKAEH